MALIKKDPPAKEEVKTEDIASENAVQEKVETPKATITLTPEELKALIQEEVRKAQPIVEETKTAVESKKEKEPIKKIVNTDNIPELDNFEYKSRRYEIISGTKAHSYGIRNRSNSTSRLQYIHPDTKQPFSLRLTSNQPSFFEENQPKEKGSCRIRYINFKDGKLFVPASDVMLQQFLAIHPDNGVVFREIDEQKEAAKEIEIMDLRFKAQSLVRSLDIAKQTAVARILCDDYSDTWTSGVMRMNLFAKVEASAKPLDIINLCENEDLLIESLAKTALKRGFLNYANYRFTDERGQLILEVGRNDNEWKAITRYLLSNEGNDLRNHLEDKMF